MTRKEGTAEFAENAEKIVPIRMVVS